MTYANKKRSNYIMKEGICCEKESFISVIGIGNYFCSAIYSYGRRYYNYRGQGNSFGMNYAAESAAKSLIPQYKERAERSFYLQKQEDYNYAVDMINKLKDAYNDDVKALAIQYNITNYSAYLLK